jgi:hypothetical protein
MPDISQEELDRLKAQDESAKKLADKNAELLAEKKKLADEKKALEDAKAAAEAQALKEKGDYKALAEKLEADKKAADDKAAASEKARVEEKKKNALSLELDKLGCIPERKSFVMASADLTGVTYNETANVVLGAEVVAKTLQSTCPELFGKPVNLPGQGGQGSGGTGGNGTGGSAPAHMSDDWFKGLSLADQDKYRAEYLKSKGIDIKKKQA